MWMCLRLVLVVYGFKKSKAFHLIYLMAHELHCIESEQRVCFPKKLENFFLMVEVLNFDLNFP